MAKISPPLTIPDTDRCILETMCVGNDEQSMRARIVLACAESKQNNEIAESLGVSSARVSKWKEAYRSQGLEGIKVSRAGGRPTKYANHADLAQAITDRIHMHPDWGADDIAKDLGLPKSKVFYELSKLGITLERTHIWLYKVHDPIASWNPHMIFLYRAYGCGVVIAYESVWAVNEGHVGIFETRNRLLMEELQKSVLPVTLPGILYTAQRFANSSSGSAEPIGKLVERVIDAWVEDVPDSGAIFHIFSFGQRAFYEGKNVLSCQYYVYPTEEEMTNAFIHWMGSKCTGRELIAVENLMSDLRDYGASVTEKTLPFIWYLGGINEAITVQNANTDSNDVPLTTKSGAEGRNLENLNNAELTELMGAIAERTKENRREGTTVGAILYQVDQEGNTYYRLVQSDHTFQAMDTFDFSSKEGFERDLSRLEEDSLSFGQSIATANDELYLGNVKKN